MPQDRPWGRTYVDIRPSSGSKYGQCAQIAKRGTYRHDCTPYSCEASRERRRGALLLFYTCRSRTRERLLLLLLTSYYLLLLDPSSCPTRFTRIRRAIVSVGTPVCNLSTLSTVRTRLFLGDTQSGESDVKSAHTDRRL